MLNGATAAQTGARTTAASRMDLEAQLQAFKKEQEAKQEAEMAVFLAKLKKEQAAKQAADPKLFAQSYVDEKLREHADRHAKELARGRF